MQVLLKPPTHTTEIFGESISKKIILSQSKPTLTPLKTSFPNNRFKLQATRTLTDQQNSKSRAGTHTYLFYSCDDNKYRGAQKMYTHLKEGKNY